jgi:PAS domain S-box-containing protein
MTMKDSHQPDSTREQHEPATSELPRAMQAAAVLQMEQTKILAAILDQMGDAVIAADRNETFLVFNPAAQEMVGKGPTELTSADWPKHYGFYLSDQTTLYPADRLPLVRAIHGEELNNVEMFIKNDKAPHGLSTIVSGRPLKDASGHTVGGIIVMRDVTAQKHEEAFRAEQAHLLEMIAANVPLGEILSNLVLLIESQSRDMIC